MSDEAEKKATTPDAQQASIDGAQLKAAERDSPRAARRCWTPQEARNFASWDD